MTNQEKSKIFIASSGRALLLAQKLRDNLASPFSEATVWNDANRGQAGLTIIEMLESATQNYDFAVIILSRDDVVFREGGDQEKRQARDNCIFEAGLFMGALGRNRVFLVSSVRKEELPVDLQGIIYHPLTEPADLTSHALCNKETKQPAQKIRQAVQTEGLRGKKPK